MRSICRLCLATLLLVNPAAGEVTGAGPCTIAGYRQFDFWLGDWDVVDRQDQPAGTSRIVAIAGGCVVSEAWQSAGSDYHGYSYNIYDQASGRWHQTWVDSSGLLLQLDGGLDGDSMVLEGVRPGRDGGSVRHRISWTPTGDGTLRQHWQSSSDAETWVTLFDGRYTRNPSTAR